MKHSYLLLLAAGLLVAGCKKEKVEEIPYKPHETAEEEAMGVNYFLVGRWVITGEVMKDQGPLAGADRWTFKADSTYLKLYLGDIGQDGTYKTVATNGNDALTFELFASRYNSTVHLLIEKKSYRHILINGVNFFRED